MRKIMKMLGELGSELTGLVAVVRNLRLQFESLKGQADEPVAIEAEPATGKTAKRKPAGKKRGAAKA